MSIGAQRTTVAENLQHPITKTATRVSDTGYLGKGNL